MVAALRAAAGVWCRVAPLVLAVTGGLVIASHGLLDTLIARIVSHDGVRLTAHEALLFAPAWLIAAWPRRRKRTREAAA